MTDSSTTVEQRQGATRLQASYSQIWLIAYPIIFGGLGQNLINVVNTAFLAHVGQVELGASALAGIIYFLCVTISLGFANGIQILVARRMGEGKERQVGNIVDQALYQSAAVALFLFVGLKFGVPWLLPYVIKDQAIRQAMSSYLSIRAVEIFFTTIFWTWRGFYSGIGQTRVLIFSTLALVGVNITLDYALIFGNLGLPRMGMDGAAISSVIAEAISALIVTANILLLGYARRFGIFRFPRIHWPTLGRLTDLSLPMVLQSIISMSSWFIFFLIIANMGEASLATSNIIRSVYSLFMIPTWGFAAAANTLVSNTIGQRKPRLVYLAVGRVAGLSLLVTGVLALVPLLFPALVLSPFISDKGLLGGIHGSAAIHLVAEAIPSLRMVMLALVLFSVAYVLLSSVTGTGATRFAFYTEVGIISIYLVYLWLGITHWHFNLVAAWTAEALYWALLIAATMLYLKSGKWRTQKL